jgi:hypothetical protein
MLVRRDPNGVAVHFPAEVAMTLPYRHTTRNQYGDDKQHDKKRSQTELERASFHLRL